jgi:hypothetical protein
MSPDEQAIHREHPTTRENKNAQGHVQDIKKLFIDGKSSNLFATHFASLVPQGTAKKSVKDFIKATRSLV